MKTNSLLLCFCFKHVESITSLQEIVYYELQSENFAMCYRRMNATHQVGCSCKFFLHTSQFWVCSTLPFIPSILQVASNAPCFVCAQSMHEVLTCGILGAHLKPTWNLPSAKPGDQMLIARYTIFKA